MSVVANGGGGGDAADALAKDVAGGGGGAWEGVALGWREEATAITRPRSRAGAGGVCCYADLAPPAAAWGASPAEDGQPPASITSVRSDSALNSMEYWDYSVELECLSGPEGIFIRPANLWRGEEGSQALQLESVKSQIGWSLTREGICPCIVSLAARARRPTIARISYSEHESAVPLVLALVVFGSSFAGFVFF